MTYEEFLNLNDKYRFVCEWNDDLSDFDKNSYFIPCYHNKGIIYWKSEDKMGLIMFTTPTVPLEKVKQKIQVDVFGELGEYYIEFNPSDIEIIAECFLAKKQASRPIPPHSVRNITTFLRVMQNIHPRYKKKLEEYIEKNRDLTR